MPVLEWFREWIGRKSPVFKELFHCPYCCSHWVALVLSFIYWPAFVHSGWPVADFIVSWLAIVGGAIVPVFMLLFISRLEP